MVNQLLGISTISICILLFFVVYRQEQKGTWQWSLTLILLAGLLLRIFVSTDLYLHDWDERFHALVAKNLMAHPLLPTLYEHPVLGYDYTSWNMNHIWVHKQPVPLWSIATSMQLFGVSTWAMRLPSILLSSLTIFSTFFIGQYVFNRRVGLLAAFFFSINGFIIELTGGRRATDHIDVFFMAWIALAIVCAILYIQQKNRYWILPIAICTSLAILTKWLPALIVLPVWFLLAFESKKIKILLFDGIIISLLIVLCVAPWQLYIHEYFPLEATFEMEFNKRHVFEALEGMNGKWWYHLHKSMQIWNESIFIAIGWAVALFYKKKSQKILALLMWFGIPLLFFTIVQTKMPAYLLFTAPAVLVILAAFIIEIPILFSKRKKLGFGLILIIITLSIRYSIERIKPFQNREIYPAWSQRLQEGEGQNWTAKDVIFNEPHYINAMFYTDCAAAYPYSPTPKQTEMLEKQGFSIIFVKTNSK